MCAHEQNFILETSKFVGEGASVISVHSFPNLTMSLFQNRIGHCYTRPALNDDDHAERTAAETLSDILRS